MAKSKHLFGFIKRSHRAVFEQLGKRTSWWLHSYVPPNRFFCQRVPLNHPRMDPTVTPVATTTPAQTSPLQIRMPEENIVLHPSELLYYTWHGTSLDWWSLHLIRAYLVKKEKQSVPDLKISTADFLSLGTLEPQAFLKVLLLFSQKWKGVLEILPFLLALLLTYCGTREGNNYSLPQFSHLRNRIIHP